MVEEVAVADGFHRPAGGYVSILIEFPLATRGTECAYFPSLGSQARSYLHLREAVNPYWQGCQARVTPGFSSGSPTIFSACPSCMRPKQWFSDSSAVTWSLANIRS